MQNETGMSEENILDIARRVRASLPIDYAEDEPQLADAVERMAQTLDSAYLDLVMAYDFLTKPEHYGTDPVAWLDDAMGKMRDVLRELGIPLEEAGDE